MLPWLRLEAAATGDLPIFFPRLQRPIGSKPVGFFAQLEKMVYCH